MNKFQKGILFALFSAIPVFSWAQEAPQAASFKTLKITYQTMHEEQNGPNPLLKTSGKEVRLIDAVRSRTREERFQEDPDGNPALDWIAIYDGSNTYVVDRLRNDAIRYPGLLAGQPMVWGDQESIIMGGNPGPFAEQSRHPSWMDQGPHRLKESLIGTEKIAGKPCEIYKAKIVGMEMKSWYWRGVLLKQEILSYDVYDRFYHKKEAVLVEEDIALKDSLFQPPTGIPIQAKEEASREEAEEVGQEKSSEFSQRIFQPPWRTIKFTSMQVFELKDLSGGPISRAVEKTVKWIDFEGKRMRIEHWAVGSSDPTLLDVEISDGPQRYTVVPSLNSAYIEEPLQDWMSFWWKDDLDSWRESHANERNRVGKEEILGRPCDIYETFSLKGWVWNSLVIKMENRGRQLGVSHYREVVEIEENPAVSPELFRLPKGVSVQPSQNFEEGLRWAEAMVAKLGVADIQNGVLLTAFLYPQYPKKEEKLFEIIRSTSTLSDEEKREKTEMLRKELTKLHVARGQSKGGP